MGEKGSNKPKIRMEAWTVRRNTYGKEDLIIALTNGSALRFESGKFEMFWEEPGRFLAINKNRGLEVAVEDYFDGNELYGTAKWSKLKSERRARAEV